MARYTKRLVSIRMEDAAGLGMTFGPSDGDFSGGEQNAENAEHQPVYDRDVHDGFTLGQDLVQECSLTLQMKNEALTSGASARVIDFLQKRGTFAAAVSVDPTIWAWVTILTFDDGTTSTTRTYPKCEGGHTIQEGQPSNTFGISYKNHLAPVDA